MKRLALTLALIPVLAGCSLNNKGPGQTGPPDWDRLAPTIQSRVKYISAFAFTMDKVKPHKANICEVAKGLSEFLATYDDKDANFDRLRAAVIEYVERIQDPGARDAVLIFVDMVLTEAFNYAWQHYQGLLETDEARTVMLIANAIATGLTEACKMVTS